MDKMYLGGGIMSHGDQLCREEEYNTISREQLPFDIYSPVLNKSINDKSNITEEENNVLAEKIVKADIDRLWESDVTVMSPEQHAIGTMCETAVLYGWKYMLEKLSNEAFEEFWKTHETLSVSDDKQMADLMRIIINLYSKQYNKKNYFHYFDIRTNHLNEKDWRRSFSINQMLYGMILYAAEDSKLHNSFNEVIDELKKKYNGQEAKHE